jgi:predicted secreted hydrolase
MKINSRIGRLAASAQQKSGKFYSSVWRFLQNPKISAYTSSKSFLALGCCLVLILPLVAQSPYQLALPNYHYSFPHDHFSHPAFQTEWWYYTGNLKSSEGHRFGFELTFFRQAIHRGAPKKSSWDVDDLYLAHVALSDIDGGHFYHAERTNRSGPGIAGVNESSARFWNGNWQIQWKENDQQLQAIEPQFELQLHLHSEKLPVIHGENGVSQKAQGPGRASHYISLTRLTTSGEILLNGKSIQVAGLSWMDHEFFTHQLDPDQVGWDWLSLQLDDHTELMLFRIRRKDGSIDPFSAGTYIDAQGHSTHLRASDFVLEPARDSQSDSTWTSPISHATYPIRWHITIPSLGISLDAKSALASQELAGASKLAPTYWEGAITLAGQRSRPSPKGTPVQEPLQGVGYLEMTGYDRPVTLAP